MPSTRPSSASTRSEGDGEGVAVLSPGPAGPEGGVDPPKREPPAIEPPRPVLVPFCFWLPRASGATLPLHPHHPAASASPHSDPPDPAALRDAIAAHLVDLGWPGADPLRWAITAVDPLRGLQLEGVGVIQGQACHRERR